MPYKDSERQKVAQRKHYESNKDTYKERVNVARQRRQEKLSELKRRPCVDCEGIYPPYVMQFDHIGDNKIDTVSRLLRSASWERVLQEIEKCELVCANCHAVRTYERGQRFLRPSIP